MIDEALIREAICELYSIKFDTECGSAPSLCRIQKAIDLICDAIDGGNDSLEAQRLRSDKRL